MLSLQQWSLFLFCEGTRSRATTPKLLPFKKGAFHIARQQNVPIVPVVMGNYYPVYNFKEKRWTSADGFNSHVQIPIRGRLSFIRFKNKPSESNYFI